MNLTFTYGYRPPSLPLCLSPGPVVPPFPLGFRGFA